MSLRRNTLTSQSGSGLQTPPDKTYNRNRNRLYIVSFNLDTLDISRLQDGDGNSPLCRYSVRLKGTNHGHLLRTYYEYGVKDSIGPFVSAAFGCA